MRWRLVVLLAALFVASAPGPAECPAPRQFWADVEILGILPEEAALLDPCVGVITDEKVEKYGRIRSRALP